MSSRRQHKYKKIWEQHHGPVPEGYHIHHIDGNHENNHIDNLTIMTAEEHYAWHWKHDRDKKIAGMLGKKKTRKTLSDEEFREMQRKKSLASKEKNATKILYNGTVYLGWNDLLTQTGVSKYKFKKHSLGEIL